MCQYAYACEAVPKASYPVVGWVIQWWACLSHTAQRAAGWEFIPALSRGCGRFLPARPCGAAGFRRMADPLAARTVRAGPSAGRRSIPKSNYRTAS
jgi:hypothetical protein